MTQPAGRNQHARRKVQWPLVTKTYDQNRGNDHRGRGDLDEMAGLTISRRAAVMIIAQVVYSARRPRRNGKQNAQHQICHPTT